jgi:hypothetical protein
LALLPYLLLRDITVDEALCTSAVRKFLTVMKSAAAAAPAPAPASAVTSGSNSSGDTAMSSSSVIIEEMESEIRLRMGVAMWLAGGRLRLDQKACLETLLACARGKTCNILPCRATVYTLLGHLYSYFRSLDDAAKGASGDSLQNKARAMKCYQRALGYNPFDIEAGFSLSKLMLESDDIPAAKVH